MIKLKKVKNCNNCELNCSYEKEDTLTFEVDGYLYCKSTNKNSCSGDCKVDIRVPMIWLDCAVKKHGFSCIDQFYSNYLYSESNKILERALNDNKVLDISEIFGCVEKTEN